MAKSEHPPKKKGTKDPLLAELQNVLNGAARGPASRTPDAEPTPAPVTEPVPEVPPAVREHEAEVQNEVDKNIEAERVATPTAEKTRKPRVIPPELAKIYGDTVPQKTLSMYRGLKDPKTKEAVISSLIADEAKKKEREQREAQEAAVAPRVEPPPEDDALLNLFKGQRNQGEVLPQGMHRRERGPEKIIPNSEEAINQEHVQEVLGGVGESRSMLRTLIDGYKKTLEGAQKIKEDLEGKSFKESMGYLGGRVKELDAALAPMAEKFAEKIGEAYNKSPLWEKITLGVALTVGYGFTLPVSTIGAGLFGGAIAFQRAYGLAGTFRSFEKKFEAVNEGKAEGMLANTRLYKWLASGPESSRKEKAMAGAVIYSLGMAGASSLAAYELASHHVGERIGEWIRSHMPGGETGATAVSAGSSEAVPTPGSVPAGTEATPTPTPTLESSAIPPPVVEAPAAAAAAGEVAVPTPEVAIPSITVEASPGHGYEYMMKRLWEQLQSQQLDASKFDADSDIHKLLTADATTIDKVVHQIAADPQHGFFNPDGTSIRIDSGAGMGFGRSGEIILGNSNDEWILHAPEGAHLTPAYHPEAPTPVISEGLTQTQAEELAKQKIDAATSVEHITVLPTEPPSAPSLEEVDMNTVTPDQTVLPVEAPEHPLETAPLSPDAPPPSVAEHVKEFVNQHNISIDPIQGHVFQDTSGATVAYGNDFAVRLDVAQEFAKANPGTSVWVQAEKPIFHEGAWRPWVHEVKSEGLIFRSVRILNPDGPTDPSQIGAIKPETFMKQLDK